MFFFIWSHGRNELSHKKRSSFYQLVNSSIYLIINANLLKLQNTMQWKKTTAAAYSYGNKIQEQLSNRLIIWRSPIKHPYGLQKRRRYLWALQKLQHIGVFEQRRVFDGPQQIPAAQTHISHQDPVRSTAEPLTFTSLSRPIKRPEKCQRFT